MYIIKALSNHNMSLLALRLVNLLLQVGKRTKFLVLLSLSMVSEVDLSIKSKFSPIINFRAEIGPLMKFKIMVYNLIQLIKSYQNQ